MTIRVETVSVCDRCGVTDTREGAQSESPPVGWARATVTNRYDGDGWTRNRHTEAVLCVPCSGDVRRAMSAGWKVVEA